MDNKKGLIVDYGHIVVVYRKASGELSCRLERAARELASKNYEDGDKEVGIARIPKWISALNSFHWVEVSTINVKPCKDGDYKITWEGKLVKPEERKSEETLTIFDKDKDLIITKKITKRFGGYGDYNDFCPSWRAKEEILETVDVSENHKSVSEKIKSLPKPGKNGLEWDKEMAPVKNKTKETGKYFLAVRNEEVRLLQYVTEKTVYGPYSVYTEEEPCEDNGWKWTIRKHKFNAKTISVKTPTLVRSISSEVLMDKLVSDKEISKLIINKIK